jgi:hypothetical protein
MLLCLFAYIKKDKILLAAVIFLKFKFQEGIPLFVKYKNVEKKFDLLHKIFN